MRSRCWVDIGPVESDMADCEGERLEIELELETVAIDVGRLLAVLDTVPFE